MSIKRILIVDDEEAIRSLLKRCFERLGANYQVVTVEDGFNALEQIREHPFDLMVTDYKMPGMNGLDLVKAARQILPKIQIVLITGHYTLELGQAIDQINLDGYIDKPFTPDQFLTVIQQIDSVQMWRNDNEKSY